MLYAVWTVRQVARADGKRGSPIMCVIIVSCMSPGVSLEGSGVAKAQRDAHKHKKNCREQKSQGAPQGAPKLQEASSALRLLHACAVLLATKATRRSAVA